MNDLSVSYIIHFFIYLIKYIIHDFFLDFSLSMYNLLRWPYCKSGRLACRRSGFQPLLRQTYTVKTNKWPFHCQELGNKMWLSRVLEDYNKRMPRVTVDAVCTLENPQCSMATSVEHDDVSLWVKHSGEGHRHKMYA